MGIFDKAADKLQRRSEETVRMVDYDAIPVVQKDERKKAVRRPKLDDLLPSAPKKNRVEPEAEDEHVFSDGDFERIANASAFSNDEDDPAFSYEKDSSSGSLFESLSEKAKSSQPEVIQFDEEKVRDVLDILKIPATFVIPSDILMPEDFDKIDFDLQVPKGYDLGQVEFFVERSKSTVEEYLSLLEKRNEHIAKLATTIDRLQVDLQNLKYDSQIAEGIGIIPTSDNVELEKENVELKLLVKRLEDQIKIKSKTPDLSSKERDLYENLRNQYSIVVREKEDLEQQVAELKLALAKREEDADDPTWMAGAQSEMPKNFDLTEISNNFGKADEETKGSSVFSFDSNGENPQKENPLKRPKLPNLSDEDDEDELDKLMKDWS